VYAGYAELHVEHGRSHFVSNPTIRANPTIKKKEALKGAIPFPLNSSFLDPISWISRWVAMGLVSGLIPSEN
jgi:hypothetical protein